MPLWKIDESKSSDTWLELTDALDPSDVGEMWTAVAKWDACVHLYRHGNGDKEPDYIHFCGPHDIRRWIARLEELLVVAKAYHRDHGNAEWGWFDDEPEKDGSGGGVMFDLGLDEEHSTLAPDYHYSDHDLYFLCGCRMQYDSYNAELIRIWTDNCPFHWRDFDWYWVE